MLMLSTVSVYTAVALFTLKEARRAGFKTGLGEGWNVEVTEALMMTAACRVTRELFGHSHGGGKLQAMPAILPLFGTCVWDPTCMEPVQQ
jgi:hypothetical protein